jgi:hypothetical protein
LQQYNNNNICAKTFFRQRDNTAVVGHHVYIYIRSVYIMYIVITHTHTHIHIIYIMLQRLCFRRTLV